MAQDKALRHGVPQRADAKLQGAAIRHRRRGVQSTGIVGEIDRLARRRKQRKIGLRAVENELERAFRQVALTRHERQLAIDLSGKDKIRQALLAGGEQVEREIGVAAQTVAVLAPGNQLADDIDAARQDIAHRVGIVGRDIALLGWRHAEPLAGLEEELVDLDIPGQLSLAQRCRVSEVRIAVEQTLGNRPNESPLEFLARPRLLQSERSEDRQM